jgi:hypothetical protein
MRYALDESLLLQQSQMFLNRILAAEAKMLANFLLRRANCKMFPLVEQELIDFSLPRSQGGAHAHLDTGFLSSLQAVFQYSRHQR